MLRTLKHGCKLQRVWQQSHRCMDADIGANLTDGMFQGRYHGKQHHEPDLDAVLQRSWAAGVEKIIITAGTLSEARHALELSRRDARLFCTAGVHPTRCNEFEEHPEGPEDYMRQLQEVSSNLARRSCMQVRRASRADDAWCGRRRSRHSLCIASRIHHTCRHRVHGDVASGLHIRR